MTEDGWRPIIGTGRQPSYFQEKAQEIQRKSPNLGGGGNIEIAKSNSILLSAFPPFSLPNKFNGQNINTVRNEAAQNNKGKFKYSFLVFVKIQNPFFKENLLNLYIRCQKYF